MNNKEKYKTINPDKLKIFQQVFWLDIVAENWDVAIIEENNEIVACMPYAFKNNGVIYMPPFTPFLGPVFFKKYTNERKRRKDEKELMNDLISQLPKFKRFEQKWHYSVDNWLPFYWQGFKQTTKYTYVIDDPSDIEKTKSNFNNNIKRQLKKAEKDLMISGENNVKDFLRIHNASLNQQANNSKNSILKNLIEKCYENNHGFLYFAVDKNNTVHACSFLVYDNYSLYYLAGGQERNSNIKGGHALSLWYAMKFAAKQNKVFDFEGSMLPGVERFFCSFGATQKPYFEITKTNDRFLKLRHHSKALFKTIFFNNA